MGMSFVNSMFLSGPSFVTVEQHMTIAPRYIGSTLINHLFLQCIDNNLPIYTGHHISQYLLLSNLMACSVAWDCVPKHHWKKFAQYAHGWIMTCPDEMEMSLGLMHRHLGEQTWWRHQMETFSALLAICAGNSPVPGEFPTQRPVTRSFDVYFDLRPDKRLSKQLWGWWFETLSHSLWRHRYAHMIDMWCRIYRILCLFEIRLAGSSLAPCWDIFNYWNCIRLALTFTCKPFGALDVDMCNSHHAPQHFCKAKWMNFQIAKISARAT